MQQYTDSFVFAYYYNHTVYILSEIPFSIKNELLTLRAILKSGGPGFS
jgi:hypothetical protein